jgi:hypothetical protein
LAGLELSSRYGSSENAVSASHVWVSHQPTELENVKSDDAAAAATARWAGEAALRNATNTTTKDSTTAAAADVRHGPSPLEPPATDVGAKATTTDTTTTNTATEAVAGLRGGRGRSPGNCFIQLEPQLFVIKGEAVNRRSLSGNPDRVVVYTA